MYQDPMPRRWLASFVRPMLASLAAAVLLAPSALADTRLTTVRALDAGTVPQSVPKDFVVTPNGYFHPSCVHEIESGAHVQANGDIRRANGALSKQGICAYPHYSQSGRRIEATAGQAALGDVEAEAIGAQSISWGWIAYSGTNSSATPAIGYLSASWKVPTAPSTKGSQTVYYFPGAQRTTIIQPVLGWNALSDNAWTLSSWNCCTNGQTNYSKFVSARAGDTISGVMTGTQCSGNTCQQWAITTKDVTTGASTTLNTKPAQAYNWVFGGVMEVYSINSCSQYPASGNIAFTNVKVATTAGQAFSPTFYPTTASVTPACSYGVNATPTATTLSWAP